MLFFTEKGRLPALSILLFISALLTQTACSPTHCTGCNFEASNLSLSTSGTFLFSPVTSETMKQGTSISFPLTLNTDVNYSGDVSFSFMYPDINKLDPSGTIKFSIAPETLHMIGGESAQVVVTISTTSSTPALSSQFYLTASDTTVLNNLNPYFATVTVPLAITTP